MKSTNTFTKTFKTNSLLISLSIHTTTVVVLLVALLAGILALIPAVTSAQEEVAEVAADKKILLVSDASGSMTDLFGGVPRIDALKTATAELLSTLDPSIYVGLRPFAHVDHDTESEACIETELLQDFTLERSAVNTPTQLLQAVGPYTPLAYTLEQSAGDFSVGDDNILILLSDGKDTCGGDPAAAASALFSSAKNIKVYVIGIGVDADTRAQLSPIATAGGGVYYDATNAESFSKSFNSIVEFERPVERQLVTGSDADYKVAGGTSFYDIEDDLPRRSDPGITYQLNNHLKPGQYEYFDFYECDYKYSGTKAIELNIRSFGDDLGVTYDESDNVFKRSDSHNYKIEVFDEEQFPIGVAEVLNKNNSKDTFYFRPWEGEERSCQRHYLKIGSDDYSISKYDFFSLDVVSAEGVDFSYGDSGGVTAGTGNNSDVANSSNSDASSNQIIAGIDNIIVFGVGAGIIVLILIIILAAILGRGKVNVNSDQYPTN
jgi:hypothetical protein